MIYFNDNCQNYDKLVTTTFCYFYKHSTIIRIYMFHIYQIAGRMEREIVP